MNAGKLEVICGNDGAGKTAMALGKALLALTEQKTVIVIQFLKGSQKGENLETVKRLEPELKIFRFEKSDAYFSELAGKAKREETVNIVNGLNYARTVLTTGECELLVLDEALGLIDQGIIGEEELSSILDCRGEADVIVTGKVLSSGLKQLADRIEWVETR